MLYAKLGFWHCFGLASLYGLAGDYPEMEFTLTMRFSPCKFGFDAPLVLTPLQFSTFITSNTATSKQAFLPAIIIYKAIYGRVSKVWFFHEDQVYCGLILSQIV